MKKSEIEEGESTFNTDADITKVSVNLLRICLVASFSLRFSSSTNAQNTLLT